MNKCFVVAVTFGIIALSVSPIMAQDCLKIGDGMKKYGLTKSSFQFQYSAEESTYYYYKLPQAMKGNHYIMLETIGGCLSDYEQLISDKEFAHLKEENDKDQKSRVTRDDED